MSNPAQMLFVLQTRPVGKIIEIDPSTGNCKIVIDHLLDHPDGIVVNRLKNRITWTNMGSNVEPNSLSFFQADGSLVSAPINGDNKIVTPLVSGGLFVTGKQLTFESITRQFYWCDREGMRVLRCNEDGSNVQVLVQRGIFPKDSKDVLRHCVGIALDSKAKRFYWTQKGPPKGGKGRIFSASYDLRASEYPLKQSEIRLELADLPEPIDSEFSKDGMHLYWTDRGDNTKGGNSLNMAEFSKGRLINHQIIARGFKEAIGLTIDNDRGLIYIADSSGSVYRHDLRVKDSSEIIAKGFGPLTGLTLA